MNEENQTIFAQEEPFMENVEDLHEGDGEALKAKAKKKKLITIFAVVLGVLLISLIAVAQMSRPAIQQEQIVDQVPVEEQKDEQLTTLEKTLLQLREDISKADPTITDLPFPPVNFELYIQSE